MLTKKGKIQHTLFAGRHYLRDFDERIIVDMTVKDDTDFLSVFSENLTPIISTEVAEFIEERTSTIPPREKLTLRIYNNCIDDKEKSIYASAVTEYYKKRHVANGIELKRNNWIALLLFIAGILVLAIDTGIACFTSSHIGSEVIDVVAWVLLWEAADISFFRNNALRIKRDRYLSYISMKTEFISIEGNEI